MRLENKVALVTGAGSGIGKAAALLFAREGACVAATDVDALAARGTVEEIVAFGGDAAAYALDVSSEDQWSAVVEAVLRGWNRLDILVNNAGVSFAKPIVDMALDEWRRVMSINLDGVFLGTKAVIAAMRTAGAGAIVNVASASGIRASAGASAYSTSKAAVRMLTRASALECAEYRIRVNSVSPGGVMTPMWERMEFFQDMTATMGSVEASFDAISQGVPLKRFARPEEVARMILHLACDESSFITGADVVVDGGYTI